MQEELTDYRGPRIVINPTTFHNNKDAACVMWNEAFRIVMSDMQFDPVSEPTERQRRFFSDTAYANDETQLRRTILARICTFDTSVKDPTDEQLEEAVEFLDSVMEAGVPQNEWEQSSVQRIRDVIAQSVGATREEELPAERPAEQPVEEPAMEAQADLMGGDAEDVDRNGDGSVIDHSKDLAESGMNADNAGATAAGAAETAEATAADGAEAPVAGGQAENGEIRMLGLDMAAGNDVFQFDPYQRKGEDIEQPARDEAADIIGPMALKRDDAAAKKASGTPGAWDGSSRQIGPETKGTYNRRSPNFRGGTGSPGSWDGSFVQTGDAYRRR